MPGIRTMNSSGANGAIGQRDGEGKKRTHDGKMVNGAWTGEDSSAGASASSAPNQITQLPPELVHVAASSYHPFSKLLLRINQECYNDLNDTLQRMAGLPVSHPSNGMPNGLGAHGGQENAQSSKEKRLMMLKFAQENRAKYIKMLVLADWGKKSAVDIAKLIDLFAWSREQSNAQDMVDAQLEELKILSSQARQSNPDIRTALEILTTQKAEWLPDLGYVDSEPISSEKALSLLRYMNTSLCIRLTVHERLPRHLQNWRVHSGRATFTIENEFEFDVMSFVEDTSDQWHFIDLRLLYSPAPVIDVDSRTLFELKAIMDLNLATEGKGLEECFRYLLNFTLTHKISVLRSQANALLRTGWDGSLRVDSPHRQLVLSYWVEKPGKKSWIEIGISSNRLKNGNESWRGPPIPSLTARWFRQGTEVKDVDLKLDWHNLSAERILKRVISLHIQHLLQTTRQDIKVITDVNSILSESEPADCKLEVSMGSLANKVTLSVEPATGRYILQPVTALSAGAENAINRPQDPPPASLIVTQLLARSLVDLIQRCAQQLGWQQVGRQTLRLDAVKAAVRMDVLQFVIYRPRGWASQWALGAIIDASGESWWICKVSPTGNAIEHAQTIYMDKSHSHPDMTRQTLAAIGRVAVSTLSFYVNIKALSDSGRTFSLKYDFAQPRSGSASKRPVRGWVLHLKTSELLASKPGEDTWLQPGMRLACHGQQLKSQNVWHIATGTMVPSVAADMKKLMASSPHSDFNFSDDGHFQILLRTPFGHEAISKLITRLRDINRLRSFAMILQKRMLQLQSSSLQQVKFQYGNSLSATVRFGDGDDLKLRFASSNPHLRIQHLLTSILNSKDPRSGRGDNNHLDQFSTMLMLTRPLLTAMDAIEGSSTKTFGNPVVHVHSCTAYRMVYNNPICSFDISLRRKDDNLMWVIQDNNECLPIDLRPKNERTPGFQRQDNLAVALKSLMWRREDNWWGLGTGLAAELGGVPQALHTLHKTVMAYYTPGGVKLPPPSAAAPVKNNMNNQTKAAQQAQVHGQGMQARPNSQQAPHPHQNRTGQAVIPNGGLQRHGFNVNHHQQHNKMNAAAAAAAAAQGKGKIKKEVITID